MKGDIAMKKLDLISDEYIREAEIPEDLDVIVTEKQSFWQKLSYFMNSPAGVAMLCAVVSLSILGALVMGITGRWGEFSTPGGTVSENESDAIRTESEKNHYEYIQPLPEGTEFKITYGKDHVDEFYQALIDQGMMGMIPSYDKDGELVTTDNPDYFFDEEDIYNVTPADVYEQTGCRIFYTSWLVYLWHDGDIRILTTRPAMGSSFYPAVLCDYDMNGTLDIFYTYTAHLSGVWGSTIMAIYDTVAKKVITCETTLNGEKLPVVTDKPAVIHDISMDHRAVYCVYNAEQIVTSKIETVWGSKDLIYFFEPSEQGLMMHLPNDRKELVAPVPPITGVPELVPTVFSQYMDEYGFVGGLSESDFIHGVLSKFSYEGQPLNEMPIALGDGELPDGGFICVAAYNDEYNQFGFEHSSKFPADNNDRYSYDLRTQVALDGFALPHGMVLGDTFDQALIKMALEDLPPFTPGATVLYRVGGETLTVIWEDIDAAFNYRLVFEETETSNVSEERGVTVTRKLTLSFGHDLKLLEIAVDVSTQYSTVTVQVPDIGELPPDVEVEIKEAFFYEKVPESDKKYFSTDDLSIRYYGCYNGGFAVFVDGIFDYTEAFEYETVLGIEFEYSSGQKLLYYKDGRFYSLPEAAVAGLLSQTDVETLHSVYTS